MSGLGAGVLVAVVVHALLTFEGCELDVCQGSALHEAARHGDAAAVRRELRQGADPNQEVDDRTPLECAIDTGILRRDSDPGSVRALLDGGARPTQEALLDALGAREVGIVEMLLDAGAEASTEALRVAASPWCAGAADSPRERLATLRLLLEHGADPDGGPRGPSPLLCAAWSGQDEPVRLLLGDGADPDQGGRTPSWYVELAVEQMRHGTTPRAVLDLLPEPRGDEIANVPPLAGAVWGGDVDVARLLLDAGADPDQASDDAFTPLLAAALTGDRAMVELLLGRGADARPAVRPGVPTPAEAALRAGHPEIAQLLS